MREFVCMFSRRKSISSVIFLILVLSVFYLIIVDKGQAGLQPHNKKPRFKYFKPRTIFKTSGWTPTPKNRSSHDQNNNQRNKVRVILIWSPLFKEWSSMGFLTSGTNSFKDSDCQESRCEITTDRRRLQESDAVVFHVRTMSMFDLPPVRFRRQKWIFFSMESPPYSRFHGLEFMHNMFNWTMSYRSDSDIVVPYGRTISRNGPKEVGDLRESWMKSKLMSNRSDWDAFVPSGRIVRRPNGPILVGGLHESSKKSYRSNSAVTLPHRPMKVGDLHEIWKKKTRLAVSMVSHCSTDSQREKLVEQLQKFLEVDVFGSCGLAFCPFNKTDLCLESFASRYYFFLAFENAICEDYVTEKLFRTLRYDLIPVVFGGGNYTAVAPGRSFIDARSFKSVKDLAARMKQVASNFTWFSSYFEWRSEAYSEDVPSHCDLCKKLHSKSFELHSAYEDMNEWWVKRSRCRAWKSSNAKNELPKSVILTEG